MADQLRKDALGVHTPAIKSLMEEGVSCSQTYCNSPICVPARGSIFTGLYPNENGSIINPWCPQDAIHGDVRKGITNYYSFFEKEFDLWHTGKQHLFTADCIDSDPDSTVHWNSLETLYPDYLKKDGKRSPGGEDFKASMPEMVYGKITRVRNYSIPTTGCYEEGLEYFFDGHILNESLKAIKNRDKNKPFMLNAMFLAPHPPLDIPEPWYSQIKNEDFTLPENVGVWSENQSPLQLYNLPGYLGGRYKREDWKEIWRTYLGLVALLDHCVGEIIQELKVQGIYDDTLIIFTSDHGEMLGSHKLWQKMCMYEESVTVPLIWKFPKEMNIKAGERNGYISHIDIFPTICEILEKQAPQGISGRSILSLLKGENDKAREKIYIQFDGNGARGNFQRCIIHKGWKLIADIFKDEIFLELYHIKEDRQETKNVIFDPANKAKAENMIQDLVAHMRETKDLLSLPESLYESFIAEYGPFKK
jgi:arylsulfatase A-like enzyme